MTASLIAAGLAAVAFAVVSFFAISALETARTRRILLRRRIEAYVPSGPAQAAAQAQAVVEVLRTERAPVIRALERLVGRGAAAEKIALEMARADLPLRPGEYVALRLGLAVVLCVVATVVSGTFIIGLVMLPLTYIAARLFVTQRQKRQLGAFEKQLPEALDLLTGSLRSGFGLLQGLETVARDMPRPISDEFAQMVRDMSVGMQLEEALQSMHARVNSSDVQLLLTAMLVHHTVGGNLAEVLAGIARTIRARLHMRDEVHALTTMPRVSSYVASVIPFGIFAAMYAINQAYMSLLLTHPVGRVLLAVSLVLTVVGLVVSRRLVQLDY